MAIGGMPWSRIIWRDALVAYNLGHTAVDKLLEKNLPLPTFYYEGVVAKYKDLVKHSSF